MSKSRSPRRSTPTPATPATGLRPKAEQLSEPALRWLTARPAFLLPGCSLLLLVAGLAAPPRIGVPLLVVLGLLVGWLSFLSWPAVGRPARILRAVMLALLLVALVGRLSS